ncbi:MAG: sigma-70 family RNA polymerase sigma factor, partial [Lentisphaerota bacterium]
VTRSTPSHASRTADTGEHLPLIDKVPDPSPNPAESAVENDRARQVRLAVDSLPPRQRMALILSYFEGMSYPQVAETMGCSVGTIKTQMSRALRSLFLRLPEAASATAQGGVP